MFSRSAHVISKLRRCSQQNILWNSNQSSPKSKHEIMFQRVILFSVVIEQCPFSKACQPQCDLLCLHLDAFDFIVQSILSPCPSLKCLQWKCTKTYAESQSRLYCWIRQNIRRWYIVEKCCQGFTVYSCWFCKLGFVVPEHTMQGQEIGFNQQMAVVLWRSVPCWNINRYDQSRQDTDNAEKNNVQCKSPHLSTPSPRPLTHIVPDCAKNDRAQRVICVQIPI